MSFTETAAQKIDEAVAHARAALKLVLASTFAQITPAIETEVQTVLDHLRSERPDDPLREEFERIAVALRIMCRAAHEGCPNLYASKLLRLRRELLNA
jgi:hypothetical protein